MKRLMLGFWSACSVAPAAWGADFREQLHYTGYVHGLPVLSFSISRDQSAGGYGIGIEYHTTGVYGFFFPVKREVESQGFLQAGTVEPKRYEMNGQARGHVYHAIVTFGAGLPQVKDESPPQDQSDPRDQFQPIPTGETLNSTDYVSAVLGLLSEEAKQGRCDGDAHLFDGRTLTDMKSQSEPDEAIASYHGSIYAGMAHKCRFTGDMIAGGPKRIGTADDEKAWEKRPPPYGEGWMAPIGPNGAMELVRVAYTTQNGATMTMVLDRASPLPLQASSGTGPNG